MRHQQLEQPEVNNTNHFICNHFGPSKMAPKVIVFGPTGSVGSSAAVTAHQHGAKVVLAMRDPTKPIPGLSAAQEQEGGFERVQADLTKPDTIHAAVTQTGAKHAFLYLAFGQPDQARAGVKALKSAGIEFVVFLSGLNVQGDLANIAPSDITAWAHGQIEIALSEDFGAGGYVAVRPGVFATNMLREKAAIASGLVKLASPGARCDYIAPEDIGRVAGSLLAKGPSALEAEKTSINLCGPQRVSQEYAIGLVGKAINKDVKVEGFASEQEGVEAVAKANGFPEVWAKYLNNVMKNIEENDGMFAKVDYDEAAANVEKYGGKPAIRIEEWVEANKARFIEA